MRGVNMNFPWKLRKLAMKLGLFPVMTVLFVSYQSLAFNEPSNFSPTHDQVFRKPASRNEEPVPPTKLVKQVAGDVKEPDYIKVSINAGRYDWQIRKPGTFTAEPLSIDIQSNRAIAVSFSNFNDLKSKTNNPGTIPIYYGFGATLAETERNGWIRSVKLNRRTVTAFPGPDGINHLNRKIWPKIEITKTTRAGDYENTGYLTFTILETQYYLDNSPEKNRQTPLVPNGQISPEDHF